MTTPALTAFARGLTAEAAFDVLALARRLKAAGKDVIELQIGDSPFRSSAAAVAAAHAALDAGNTRYAPSAGLPEFRAGLAEGSRLWLVESGGPKSYAEVTYQPSDYLVFGRETAGLPSALLEENRETWVRIPMMNAEARSLNLSNCVALVLYEALRQQGFPGADHVGQQGIHPARHDAPDGVLLMPMKVVHLGKPRQ